MSLEGTDIRNIAWLARIALREDEIAAYQQEMHRILELIEQMSTFDTGQIEPMAHPLEIPARLRPDRVTEQDQHEKFGKIAPEVERRHYLVPRVIE